ncbi:MAG: hypothetical protein EBY45_17390, partial [Gammaproteobacteria bacterium]|nr:hypothetical protein [Gammaproteobacteria bacterium]
MAILLLTCITNGHIIENMSGQKLICSWFHRLALVLLLSGVAGVVSVQAPVVTALPDEFETVEGSLGYLDLPNTTEGYFGDIVDDPNGAFVLVRSTSDDSENRSNPPDPSIIKIDTSTGTRSGSIELPYTA